MDTTVIFNKHNEETIKREIIALLKNAQKNVCIAVAWLTDEDIIRPLTQLAKEGLIIRVVICNSKENFKNNEKFRDFLKFNGELFVATNPFMHHKFCIIDEDIILNGSYNWSYAASKNEENIIILKSNNSNISDSLLFKKFKVKFKYLVDKCSISIKEIETLNYLKSNTMDIGLLLSDLDENEIQKRKEFEEAVKFSIDESRKIKIQIDFTKLLERVYRDGGGVNFVKRILHEEMQTGLMKSGFKKLEEQDPPRIDLSLEYLVALPKFNVLFTEKEVTYCKILMKKYNYLFN